MKLWFAGAGIAAPKVPDMAARPAQNDGIAVGRRRALICTADPSASSTIWLRVVLDPQRRVSASRALRRQEGVGLAAIGPGLSYSLARIMRSAGPVNALRPSAISNRARRASWRSSLSGHRGGHQKDGYRRGDDDYHSTTTSSDQVKPPTGSPDAREERGSGVSDEDWRVKQMNRIALLVPSRPVRPPGRRESPAMPRSLSTRPA